MTSPPTDPYASLGAAIQELRLERGVTRSAVKDAAQISVEYLGKIERGDRRPQPDVIKRIAEALGTTPADLLVRAREVRNRQVAARSVGTVAGAALGGALASPLLGASIVTAAQSLRRRKGRQQLLKELKSRLDSLSDEELALLVASIPARTEQVEATASPVDE